MAEFYSARGWEIPPLPWTNLSPPFSRVHRRAARRFSGARVVRPRQRFAPQRYWPRLVGCQQRPHRPFRMALVNECLGLPHRSCCAGTCRSCRGPDDNSPQHSEPRCPGTSHARSVESRKSRSRTNTPPTPASSAGGTAPTPCRVRSTRTPTSAPVPPHQPQSAPDRPPAANSEGPAVEDRAAIGNVARISASASTPRFDKTNCKIRCLSPPAC